MNEAYTGRPLDRVDGPRKLTGRAAYSADVPVANIAHAVIVGSTISKGRIAQIDTAAAARAPGVLTVLTHQNAPQLPAAQRKNEPNERVLQVLQDDLVHYDGQPVAVVVADTLEHAQWAAQQISVRYEAQAPSCDLAAEQETAFEPPPSGPRGTSDSRRGEFAQAFAAAPVRVEQTYTMPSENHNPMELHATIALWQGSQRLTLYDATQGISNVQKRAAQLFELKPENVRVISHYLGGGFGCKGTPWSHVILAAMAARVAKRPVKLVITRAQMFHFVGYRPRLIQRVALSANNDGALTAMRHDVLSQTSRIDEFMEPAAYATRMLYSCANVQTSHRLARLDVATPTFMRAPGESSGSFALESAMDELAWSLKMNPLELRLKNYADTDEDERRPYSSKSLRECYRQGAERFGWSRWRAQPRAMREGRYLIGLGMATATYPARQSPATVLVRVSADGTATVLTGSQDLGTGTYTVMTQIAADALGMPIEKVHFDLGDTQYPPAPLSAGSQTASSVGSAVRMAALALRHRLEDLVLTDARSPLYGLSRETLTAEKGGLASQTDSQRAESYAAILKRRGQDHLEIRYDEKEKEDRKNYSTHSFGAQFDEDLGEVRVSRLVGAFAAGKILNSRTGRSQLMGGMVWGIGLALQEDTERDSRNCRVVTKDLADYHVPVNADVRQIEVITVDENDPYVNDDGAKGIGELGIVGVGAAIANAVFHATGKRVRDLPITLDKLL